MDPDYETTWPVAVAFFIFLGLFMAFVGLGVSTSGLIPAGLTIAGVAILFYFGMLMYTKSTQSSG